MKNGLTAFCGVCVWAVAATAGAASDEFYFYTPHPAEAVASAASGEEGVLVKEITIRKGDTLSGISRFYSGRASYYPQILLFNQIANPNLIYAGKTLRVPVKTPAGKKEMPEHVSMPRVRQTQAKPVQTKPERKQVSTPARTTQSSRTTKGDAETQMYDRCLKAYHEGTCEKALPLFDEFLTEYPQSVHIPDVSLYRADCHLKLSGK